MKNLHISSRVFVPPFCPHRKCKHHRHSPKGWQYKKSGFYFPKCAVKRIQRYTCKTCKGTFSTQTFSTTYWQHHRLLDSKLIMRVVGCMSNRQAARDLGVGHSTIDRRISRLGRHCFVFHTLQMQNARPATEIVVDGFESFEYSQFYPMHHHVAVEKDTDFFLYFTDSPLRRKGTMTGDQKARRVVLEETYGKPDPKAIEKDMRELLEVALKGTTTAIVYSDQHKAYLRSIKQLKQQITHSVTSSKDHRGVDNELWEVNHLELVIRHSSSNHKRETIAWSKRRQCSAEKLAIFLVWFNYINGRREKQGQRSPSPAMARGMKDNRLTVRDVLDERIFRSLMELPPRWSEYYDQEVETVVYGERNKRHKLSYAY